MKARVRQKHRDTPHEVYFIQNIENRRVKIGVTIDAERRRGQLSLLAGTKGVQAVEQMTRIIAVISCPDAKSAYRLEAELHERFKGSAVGCEIFEWCDSLAAFVATLKPYREYRTERLRLAMQKVEAALHERAA